MLVHNYQMATYGYMYLVWYYNHNLSPKIENLLLNGGIQLLTSDDGLYVYIISSKFQFSSGSCEIIQSFHCFTNGRGSNRRTNVKSGKSNGM